MTNNIFVISQISLFWLFHLPIPHASAVSPDRQVHLLSHTPSPITLLPHASAVSPDRQVHPISRTPTQIAISLHASAVSSDRQVHPLSYTLTPVTFSLHASVPSKHRLVHMTTVTLYHRHGYMTRNTGISLPKPHNPIPLASHPSPTLQHRPTPTNFPTARIGSIPRPTSTPNLTYTHPDCNLTARIGNLYRLTSAEGPLHTPPSHHLTARICFTQTQNRAQLTWRKTIIKNGKKNKKKKNLLVSFLRWSGIKYLYYNFAKDPT